MSRYWRIYKTFITSSLARELEFRANFFAKILQNVVWIGFFVMILLVVYRNTNSIAGWGRGDAFILAATVFVMSAFSQAFFFSLTEIPTQVRQGTLDFVVTKPIDTQFWISARRFNFDQIGAIFAGAVMIAVGMYQGPGGASPLQWLAYFVLLVCAVLIFYSFNLAMMTTGIWLVRVDNLFILGETLTQVARFPLDIYPRMVQSIFTFAIPLGLLSTLPARQLVRGFDWRTLVLGLVWTVAALYLSRKFWRYAMRHYSSASS